MLSDFELIRYQEQIRNTYIGQEGQYKICNSRVAVVGAGGIGSASLQYLSASGVGNFGIIDYDMVDDMDIQKQSLYGGTDLGKLKTIITRQRLQKIFPLSNYEIINLQLTSSNAEFALKSYDLIIDATNDLESSYIIYDTCIALNKPFVYCSVNGSKIALSVFNYKEGPSLRNALLNYHSVITGNLSMAYGFAGLFITSEAIKIILERDLVLSGKMVTFDCLDYSIQTEIFTG
jgi:sulfur-carrier protein adenylyltransferase/sulfurtransferase